MSDPDWLTSHDDKAYGRDTRGLILRIVVVEAARSRSGPRRAELSLGPAPHALLAHRLSADDNWLPDEEAAQLRFEFETEIRRLEAA